MKCNEFEKKSEPFLDRELEAAESHEVTRHLAECKPCADAFESQKAFHLLLRQMVNHPITLVPAGLKLRIRTNLDQHVLPERVEPAVLARVPPRFFGTAAMAASFLFAFSGLFIFQGMCIHKQCPLVRAAQHEADNIVAGAQKAEHGDSAHLVSFATQQIQKFPGVGNLIKCGLEPATYGLCQVEGLPQGVFVKYVPCHLDSEPVTIMVIDTPQTPSGELLKQRFIAATQANHNILSWRCRKSGLLYILVTKRPLDNALEVAETLALGR